MKRKIKLQILKDRFESEYKKSKDVKKYYCYMIIKKIEKELKK